MDKKIFIYIAVIVVILCAIYFGQQTFLNKTGKNLISGVQDKMGAVISNGANSAISNITPQIQNGGEAVKKQFEQTKKNISENILEKTKNYFSGITDAIMGKENANNCACPPTETSPE